MNFTDEQNATLSGAIAAWGVESQKAMAVGEIGELLTMFGREVQGRATAEEWATEIADVMVTVEQLAHMIGYDLVLEKKDYKMDRLQAKVTRALTGGTG